jgi:hypothetical protein
MKFLRTILSMITKLLLAPTIAAGKGKGCRVSGLGLVIIATVLIVAFWKTPAVERGVFATAIAGGACKVVKLLLKK